MKAEYRIQNTEYRIQEPGVGKASLAGDDPYNRQLLTANC
jgi:hypothetical protein